MKPNKIERLKKVCRPFAFKERLHTLDLEDLSEEARFYLKNYGIYNSKLLPEKFMLRIRIAGGRITRKALGTIAAIVKQYGLEMLLTARAQIELHGLSAATVLEVWQALHDAGLSTLQTLTDNFRNIVTDPYDGVASENQIEVYPLIEAMQSLFLNQPEWMGMLPRKCNIAISGTAKQPTHFFGNDLYFALAQKEERWGFNLYLGGKNSEAAQNADIFVLPEEVAALFKAVAFAYRAHGLRGSRAKTRLFHLLEEIGMEPFREKIASCYPSILETAGRNHGGKKVYAEFEMLKDGTYGYCFRTKFGKVETDRLTVLLAQAEERALQIRIGVDQNFYLVGLAEPEMPGETSGSAASVTACAGSQYCALSLWNIKTDTAALPLEKIAQHRIQVGFSGCLKGCGRHHHADIGLVGLRTNIFGGTQKAARVFLGGEYSSGNAVARLVFHAVPLKHLSSLLEVIIEAYEFSGESDFETFCSRYLNVHSTYFITLWFLARLYLPLPIRLELLPESELYKKLVAQRGFPRFAEDENYIRSIKVMMHALWDDPAMHTS